MKSKQIMKRAGFLSLVLGGMLISSFPLVAQDIRPVMSAMEVMWPKNKAVHIVFHGHSVPSGYHKTPEVRTFESYPHLFHVWLKERYPHAVINVMVTAIGGEDSVSGAARFERDVLPLRPDMIFIDYALNDRRKPLDQVEAAWRSMIQTAKKHRIPLVLLTPTGDGTADMNDPADPLRQRADLIRRLATEEGVLLADVSAAWLAELKSGTPQSELLSQVNHPNLRGHKVALSAIAKCMQANASVPEAQK
jgi:acyl-CoA thioesterase I